MNNQLVTVASFQFVPEAEVWKLLLESEGFTVFLSDAETVNMDWFLGNAIGYVKLQVPCSQGEAALAAVERIRSERRVRSAEEDDNEQEMCLACGAALPDDAEKCPACGWTYTSKNEPAE